MPPDELAIDDEYWLCDTCGHAGHCASAHLRPFEQECVTWAEANSAARHNYDTARRDYEQDRRVWQQSDRAYE